MNGSQSTTPDSSGRVTPTVPAKLGKIDRGSDAKPAIDTKLAKQLRVHEEELSPKSLPMRGASGSVDAGVSNERHPRKLNASGNDAPDLEISESVIRDPSFPVVADGDAKST